MQLLFPFLLYGYPLSIYKIVKCQESSYIKTKYSRKRAGNAIDISLLFLMYCSNNSSSSYSLKIKKKLIHVALQLLKTVAALWHAKRNRGYAKTFVKSHTLCIFIHIKYLTHLDNVTRCEYENSIYLLATQKHKKTRNRLLRTQNIYDSLSVCIRKKMLQSFVKQKTLEATTHTLTQMTATTDSNNKKNYYKCMQLPLLRVPQLPLSLQS